MVWSYRFPTSVYQCQVVQNKSVSCDSLEFGTFKPNSDIAGPGVVLSFEITLGLTIAASCIALVVQGREYLAKDNEDNPKESVGEDENPDNNINSWRILLDGLLVGLSDTQGVTGLALLVVTLFNSACTLSAYHYDLVCLLVLMSLIVHFCSITVISHYFKVWWLAVLRSIIIGGNFFLGLALLIHRASHNFPLTTPSFDGLPLEPSDSGTVNGTEIPGSSLVLPAVCFMGNSTMSDPADKSSKSITGLVEYVLLLFFFLVAVALAILHSRFLRSGRPFKKTRWTYWARGALSGAGIVASIVLIYQVTHFQNWMNESGWFDGDDESSYEGFGQLVPLIMLGLPVLGFLEGCAVVADAFGGKKPEG